MGLPAGEFRLNQVTREVRDMRRREVLIAATSALVTAPVLVRANDQAHLNLSDLYGDGLAFSERALALEGTRVSVKGYMAPPLRANVAFFVLTQRPMSSCPFCETEAEWPEDILAVYTKRPLRPKPFNVNLVTRGVLELGALRDEDTGFVSRVRLADATYEEAWRV